jgi:hypothetical protein
MKRGCVNGTFNVEELVYFTVIVNDKPYTVKYKIIEKIKCIEGSGYVIDASQEQDDPEIPELLKQQKIGANFRICGDSLFKTKEGARKKAREYFQKIVDQLS